MIRLADYLADKLVEYGIRHVFMLTGGGSMHLNDAFGNHPDLKVVYCHHEQACAMAAEAYHRLTGKIAAVCVTTGPGGINAINGVFGAYVDSLAMVVISGQVKRNTLIGSAGIPLRQMGDQEVDIISMVRGITKFAKLVDEPTLIRRHIEEALFLATNGRPGPVWLDVPIDVQAAAIDPSLLEGYIANDTIQSVTDAQIDYVITKIKNSLRPVIYIGSGVRISGQYDNFHKLVNTLKIPVVHGFNSQDLIEYEHPCNIGQAGTFGIRSANFAVQNSDLLIILGCKLSIRQVSYNWENFASRAFKIMVDVDKSEMDKHSLKIDYKVLADLREFIPSINNCLSDYSPTHNEWVTWCKERFIKYNPVLPSYRETPSPVNPYVFIDELFQQLREDDVVACGDGTACVVTFQAAKIKHNQRVFHNNNCASMGYDLPAVVGCLAGRPGIDRIVCLAGDGSIMQNMQELQTIKNFNTPTKIFILNNNGYQSIKITQKSFFPGRSVGCGPDSGVTFPEFKKVASAFGYSYFFCDNHYDLKSVIYKALNNNRHSICEIMLDEKQMFAPKVTSKKMPDGSMMASSLEDMSPFLSEQELKDNMI